MTQNLTPLNLKHVVCFTIYWKFTDDLLLELLKAIKLIEVFA